MKLTIIYASLIAFSTSLLAADEIVDLDVMTKIKQEGTFNSQAMEIVQHLTTNIGPRLSGTPAVNKANQYALNKLQEFGLTNGHLDPFKFGQGWQAESASVVITQPRVSQLYAVANSWYPGTKGEVEGDVIHVSIRSPRDFERYKGKLEGKIIIEQPLVRIREATNNVFLRLEKDDINRADTTTIAPLYPILPTPEAREQDLLSYKGDAKFNLDKLDFFQQQGALAVVEPSKSAHANSELATGDRFFLAGHTPKIAKVTVTRDGFNRIHRLLQTGETVRVKVDVKAQFFDKDDNQYNVIADIEGTDKKHEIVMTGAHIDSLPLGDGAADNAAGVAIMMEAMRILKALDVKPRRTIRIALWGAEEQGIIGSRSYVQKHLASYPVFEGEKFDFLPRTDRFDTAVKPKFTKEYENLSVYFNLDNGAGKIRGIYGSSNLKAINIFNQWFAPFKDLGVTKAVNRGAGATDHRSFQSVGLPGYQFMQDPLDYFSRTQHTQLDTIDYIKAEDLKQSAIIVAAFLYNASMREELMPRKPWVGF